MRYMRQTASFEADVTAHAFKDDDNSLQFEDERLEEVRVNGISYGIDQLRNRFGYVFVSQLENLLTTNLDPDAWDD